MASLIRLVIGVPIAGVITFLLFMLMQVLIFTDEVELDTDVEDIRIVISEEVEELDGSGSGIDLVGSRLRNLNNSVGASFLPGAEGSRDNPSGEAAAASATFEPLPDPPGPPGGN